MRCSATFIELEMRSSLVIEKMEKKFGVTARVLEIRACFNSFALNLILRFGRRFCPARSGDPKEFMTKLEQVPQEKPIEDGNIAQYTAATWKSIPNVA